MFGVVYLVIWILYECGFCCELDISLMIKNMTSIDEHDLRIECSEKSIDFTGV